jgi:hypothetical protein
MTRAGGNAKAEGLTRRDFAHAVVKAGVATGLAAWVAPQVSSYALAQTTGSSPPSPATSEGGHPAARSIQPGERGDPAGTSIQPEKGDPSIQPGEGGDPAGPSIQPEKGDRARRTTPPAAEGVVSDPHFTG